MTAILRFEDQVVVATGSARCIGFVSALAFARAGARVTINDVEPAAVEAAER